RIEGGDVADALEWGAATAALKRTMPGDTALVTRAEVEAVLAGDAGEIDR
ncbi:sugar kinase, partial [Halobacterium sp. CBA1126]|nr:sugar kinase [Halobacterium sp. CBA1126]